MLNRENNTLQEAETSNRTDPVIESTSVLSKCNERAEKALQEGNKLFSTRDHHDMQMAMTKYNEGICWARSDSEQLGVGYANRSAIWSRRNEYLFALENIALARKHNYPEESISDLEAREHSCNHKLALNRGQRTVSKINLELNVELNPKIPFVAKGITMKELPRFGRCIVAEKDFKVGNVILCEKPWMACSTGGREYKDCQYCAGVNPFSIPCPHCVSVMYCNEECLSKDWKAIHRFECGIIYKITDTPYDECRMAAKMLFYGLTLFNDDVEEMMKYCQSHARTGSNPFKFDYTKNDPLAVFKMFHTAKMQPSDKVMSNNRYPTIKKLVASYLQQPLIRSLFVNKAQQAFMENFIVDYSNAVKRLVVVWRFPGQILLHTIASVCNHSCYPNTEAMCRDGQLKFVVIRPISKGDQVFISYGRKMGKTEYYRYLPAAEIDCCACVLCDRIYRNRNIHGRRRSPGFNNNLLKLRAILNDQICTKIDKRHAIQQFIQRYAHVYPLRKMHQIFYKYTLGLSVAFTAECVAERRRNCLN